MKPIRGLAIAVLAWCAFAAQPSAQPRPQAPSPQFRASTDYVSTKVVARDSNGRPVPGLKVEDFEVYEDGVRQKILSFTPWVGGRAMTAGPPPPAPTEGLIVPAAARPAAEGRIFIVFIDDLHIQFRDTQALKTILKQIRDTVLHENDQIGIVSSGYSSIAFDVGPDAGHVRMNIAIDRVSGGAKDERDIVNGAQTYDGPSGVKHDTFVALKLAYDILAQAEKVSDRSKAFIYISSGYDFNPYVDARYQALQNLYGAPPPPQANTGQPGRVDPLTSLAGAAATPLLPNPFEMNGQQFLNADLMGAIGELLSRARRAEVQIWAIDPRGLVAGPDVSSEVSARDHMDHENTRLASLDVISRGTGGECACRTNDPREMLKRLDNSLSDYYMIGYESTNHDPLKQHRRVEIRVTRPDVRLTYRPTYNVRR
jgi:VWFA-related protein